MNGAAAAIPGLMAGLGARTAIVLALALLAVAAAKRRPAAVRHVILSSALVGLLLIPLLSFGPAGWRSPLFPAWMSSWPEQVTGPKGTEAPAAPRAASSPAWNGERAEAPGPVDGASRAAGLLPFSAASSVEPRLQSREAWPSRDGAVAESSESTGGGAASARGRWGAALGPAFGLVWAAGLLALLLRLAAGLAGARRLTSRGAPLEGPGWRALLDRFMAVVALRKPVRLRSHPGVPVPLTWGWRKPVVLFPDGAGDWPVEERSSALYHELSHIKRADFLVMLLVRTSLAVFWWNPLAWIVYRELRKEQEIACDELVLRAGIRPSTYAASLLAFRRSAGLRWNPSAALLGIMGRSSFQERLAAILGQKMTLMEVKMKTKIMVALALVAAVALIGTARPAAGREANNAAPAAAERALPAAEAASPALAEEPAAQEAAPAAVQEKAKEAEKKIIVVGKDGERSPIEITVTEGDAVKKLVVGKSVTISKGPDGQLIISTPGGGEPIVVKGEPLRLEIKGGELEVIGEGKALKLDGGLTLRIAKEPGQEDATVVFFGTGKPGAAVVAGKVTPDEETPLVITKRAKDIKPGEGWVSVSPGKDGQAVEVVKEGRSGMTWTIKKGEKGDSVWVAKEFKGPGAVTWVGKDGRAFTLAQKMQDKEMLEKVRELQKQVEEIKAKKMDLSALEESLKKLEAELQANEEKLKKLGVELEALPEEFTVVEKVRPGREKGGVAYFIKEKDGAGEVGIAGSRATVKVITGEKDKGLITLVFSEKGLTKETYERTLARLKKELPKGYAIEESEYEEEASSMTFKIAPPKGQPADEALVKKLVGLIKPEPEKK